MKNTIQITLILGAFFLGICSAVNAQKKFTDGDIDYKIEIESPESMAQMLAYGAAAKVSFKGNLSKLTTLLMGGAMSMEMVANNKSKKGVSLINMMGQKKAVELKKADFTKVEQQEIDNKNIKYTKETKKIAGYVCKKAIAKNPEDGSEMILYLCDDINPKTEGFMQNLLGSLKGFPLAIEMKRGEHKVKITATAITNTAPSKSSFNLSVPEGYEKMSMETLEKQFLQYGEQFK